VPGSSRSVEPVNLGNPGEFTILELAAMVKELTGTKSEIVFQPLPQDDPVRRRPDISLAKEKLRWEPTIPLRNGLTRTIEYFRSHLIDQERRPNWPRNGCRVASEYAFSLTVDLFMDYNRSHANTPMR
jgi:hypothetical protein